MSFLPAQIYSSLFIVLVLSIIAIIVGSKVKKIKPEDETPRWLVPFVMFVDLMNNLCKQNFGKRWRAYAPYFMTLAVFLFISNISGIFGLTNPTSYILVNAALAAITFLIIQTTGIISNGIGGYLKGFLEPIFVMLPINLISECTLPISLSLRLLGNIMAGGVLSRIIVGMLGWFAIPFLPVYNLAFDIFSGLIQTVVFLLLSIIFAGMKLNDKDKLEEFSE